MKRFLISISAFLILVSTAFAQIPPGYYDSATGLTQQALQAELHNIIDNHNSQSYGAIWTHVQTTDDKPNGKVWDMYSNCDFTFVVDQDNGTGGGSECEKYNREHSWPKSWFNDQSPMNTDLHHIVPTDKKVNNVRGNFVYGEVLNATYTSQNGSKVGANTFPGSNAICFEPIDEYKGDFARIYFYMATRYYNEDGSWQTNDMVNGAQPKAWALQMLYQWHRMDTVSQKEIDRNNDIYNIQNNRNPFVDHPEWVDSIWQIGVGINKLNYSNLIKVYPNPSNGEINIIFLKNTKNQLNFALYSVDGRLIKSIQHLEKSSFRINNLERGFYILKAVTKSNEVVYNEKILVYE